MADWDGNELQCIRFEPRENHATDSLPKEASSSSIEVCILPKYGHIETVNNKSRAGRKRYVYDPAICRAVLCREESTSDEAR